MQVRPGVPVRSPSVPLGFRPAASRVPPTFCHDRSPEPEQPGRCATGNPLQVVLDLAPSAQPAYVSDFACLSGFGARASACPAQSAYVNEPSPAGAPSLPDIVQEDTAMEANVLQAGKPSVECAPRHVVLGLSSPPSVALGFRPDSAVQPPLVPGTVSDYVFSFMLPHAAELSHSVNPSRVAPSLNALEGWPSTSRAAPSEVLEVSAATPEHDCNVRAPTSRAAPSAVPEVSAATPKHDCKVCAPTSRAAPSAVPAGSAATPIIAEVTTAAHPHSQARAPCSAKVAGEACWAPVVLAFQSSCVGQCTHAMWHSLGSMMHNALRGTRSGEASHPGPVFPPHEECSHDPHRAERTMVGLWATCFRAWISRRCCCPSSLR